MSSPPHQLQLRSFGSAGASPHPGQLPRLQIAGDQSASPGIVHNADDVIITDPGANRTLSRDHLPVTDNRHGGRHVDDIMGMTSHQLPMCVSVAPLGGLEGHRRRRTAFTGDQLLELEKEFHSKKYLSLTERSQLAHDLQLSEVCIYLTLYPAITTDCQLPRPHPAIGLLVNYLALYPALTI